jgi:hypothetical protein
LPRLEAAALAAPDHRTAQKPEPRGDRDRCERTLANSVIEPGIDVAKGFTAALAEIFRHLLRQTGNVVSHAPKSRWTSSIVARSADPPNRGAGSVVLDAIERGARCADC